MKKIAFSVLAVCLCLSTLSLYSQNYQVKLGEEFKLKKGTANLEILYADNSGLYFTEARLKMGFVPISSNNANSQRLMKFDKDHNPIFEKEYKTELKGYNFNSFQVIGKDIYMFATDFIPKDRMYRIYGAKLTKEDGGITSRLTELGSFPLEHKRDRYEMKVSSVRQGKNILMVANISEKDHISLGVSLLDNSLAVVESATINLAFNEKEYVLQDVLFTSSNKILLLGKRFEEVQVSKRKKKMIFKNYTLSVYSAKGQKEKEVVLDAGERFVIGGQLIEQANGEMLMAGFYSNKAKKEELNGFFINKVDPTNGTLTLASYKEINAGMLGNSIADNSSDDEEDSDKKKKSSKDEDDEEEFPNEFIIRSIETNSADQSIIITSELSEYRYTHAVFRDYNNGSWTTTDRTTHTFSNKDILVISADKEGMIKWVNVLPKAQKEVVIFETPGRSGYQLQRSETSLLDYYFVRAGGLPYYSSYITLLSNNRCIFLFNDNQSNNTQAQYGDKVKAISNFKKASSTYGVSIDLSTGKISRKFIFANDGETILMPRHGYVLNNEVIIPSMRTKALAKSELKFAKITVK